MGFLHKLGPKTQSAQLRRHRASLILPLCSYCSICNNKNNCANFSAEAADSQGKGDDGSDSSLGLVLKRIQNLRTNRSPPSQQYPSPQSSYPNQQKTLSSFNQGKYPQNNDFNADREASYPPQNEGSAKTETYPAHKEEEKETGPVNLEIQHPWPEWIAFMEMLAKSGYLVIPSWLNTKAPHYNIFKDLITVRSAAFQFALTRYDILSSLSREDIKHVVEYGCPSLEKRTLFSGKRLRAYVNLEEGNVCSMCNIRNTCSKAYIKCKDEVDVSTSDMIRVLLVYGLDPLLGLADNKLHEKNSVKASICKLLRDVVELSKTPLDPDFPKPIPKEQNERKDCSEKVSTWRSNIQMEAGHWLCPGCNFLNFSRDIECMKCSDKRPQDKKPNIGERIMRSGEWICKNCKSFNFRSNMRCCQCFKIRPKRSLTEGLKISRGINWSGSQNWKCPTCNILNYGSRTNCVKCKSVPYKENNHQMPRQ